MATVPSLRSLSWLALGHKYLLKQMQDIRDGRRPVALMAGQVDNMTDEDLSDIAAFYDAQERSGGMSDPDKVALGRKVYLAGIADRQVPACSGCHSPTGNGNSLAGYPSLGADSTPSTLRRSLKCSERATRTQRAAQMVATRGSCAPRRSG